ncbi:MAG: tRNA (adenosine(37)-N6)-dimethylallyltransferase MiaA [Flavobacteriales bacterium]|nr:tRNA (adenosine(37)-N6)-dimethylallyltransferase MiaA [Flavobacteriales bacterium]
MVRRTLVVVGGPTASGKTALAARLAAHLGTEVISADARQFYRAMRIGTARPTGAELMGVPHHFLGHLELETTWSAGHFARAAEPVLQRILGEHGRAVLVGGSGLYIDAVVTGLDPLPEADEALRSRLRERLQHEGLAALVQHLGRLDAATAARIDTRNPQRVLRALEVCLVTGRPYSAQRRAPLQRTDMDIVRVALHPARPVLYARINTRVDAMMAAGLMDEARALLPHRHLNALNTVGYKELFQHLDGAIPRERAVELIKQHTRNYAKRQLTWLRREPRWHRVDPGDGSDALEQVLRLLP